MKNIDMCLFSLLENVAELAISIIQCPNAPCMEQG